jgi:hypothetical protein
VIIAEEEIYTTDLLPGFELPVARLFVEADMLEDARKEREGD